MLLPYAMFPEIERTLVTKDQIATRIKEMADEIVRDLEEDLAKDGESRLDEDRVIIIPIIKFSVDWWSTLHQPAGVITMDGSKVHSSILIPLLVMALAFTVMFVMMHLKVMKNEIMRRRIRTMQMQAARRAASSQAAN